jgi:hypothetical protein
MVRVSGAEAKLWRSSINPLNAELNPVCHLLALLGAHHIQHISGIRVKDSHEVGKVVFWIPIDREQTSSYHSVINASIVLGTVWKSMENRYNFEVFLLDLKYVLCKLFF